jgi:hypothetical protein
MKTTMLSALGAFLTVAAAVQGTPAFARYSREAPATSNQFRDAFAGTDGPSQSCSKDPGNPYNSETDPGGWSAWRQSGSWDSRNDCQ